MALKFSMHIQVPYGESLPRVILALHQSGEFSVFIFLLFNHSRGKNNSFSVDVHCFKPCNKMITAKLFYDQ